MAHDQLLIDAEQLQNLLIARATGEGADALNYAKLRAQFVSDSRLKNLLPRFVHTCRDLGQFWAFIKGKFDHYHERRRFLWDEFRPMLDAIEKGLASPAQETATEALSKLDPEHLREAWKKALDRVHGDADGAITAARALVESVCKLILDELHVEYADDGDLTKLYKLTARSLNLAVEQHNEQVFKQILTGCTSVIHGFSALRNSLGDAHGKGKKPVKAAPRHAQLAVNLAGAMATFLLETFEANHGKRLHATPPPQPATPSPFDDEPVF